MNVTSQFDQFNNHHQHNRNCLWSNMESLQTINICHGGEMASENRLQEPDTVKQIMFSNHNYDWWMTQKFRIEWLAGCVVHCKDFAGSFSLLQWFDLFAFCLLRRQLELFVFGWQLWDTTKQVNKGWWHLKRRHAKEKYWNSRSNTALLEIQNSIWKYIW